MANFVFNISCAICNAEFAKTDSIYSSSCGHLLHFTCMNQWQCRSTSCPLCKSYNPSTFRINLNFADVNENNLQVELQTYDEKIREMKETITEKDKKIEECKEEIKELSEDLTLRLEEIENLKSETESHKISGNKKLEDISLENLGLKEKLVQYEIQNVDLNQKIKVLELKLDLVTKELTEHMKENVDLNKADTKGKFLSTFECGNKGVGLQKGFKKHNIDEWKIKTSFQKEDLKNYKPKEKNDHKIFIKDLPRREIIPTITLKANIVLLASKMMLFLSENDIEQVNITKQRYELILDKISLIVTFANIEKKKEFISNANLLKFNESTKSILIKEFMDIDVYAVFKYANINLRPRGFHFIYCKNNQIIVKKNRNDKEITVKEKSDVDKILAFF